MARYGSSAIRGHGIPEAMEQVLTQREPHPAAHDVPQAAVGGDRDRHRRPVRRRGADHRHRRRARLARSASSLHDHRRRAQDAARRRRRGGHGGDVRQPGLRGAARGRAAAVRVPPALAHPGGARDAPRPPACASRFVGTRAGLRDAGRSRAPSGDALAVLRRRSARWSAWPSVVRHARRLRDRGRASSSCRSTGCGGRRSAASRSASSATSRRARSASATTTSRRSSAGTLAGTALRRPVRAEVRLVVDLARQRHLGRHARAAVHDRRRRSARCSARWRVARSRSSASIRASRALVGMAAMFAGASRALLASVVFAFETTRQPLGLLPLLGGCTAAYLVSCAADAQHDHDREDRAPRRQGRRASTTPIRSPTSPSPSGNVARFTHSRATQTVGEALAEIARQGYRHQAYPVLTGKRASAS